MNIKRERYFSFTKTQSFLKMLIIVVLKAYKTILTANCHKRNHNEIFFANLFQINKDKINFSKSSDLFDEFIRINGSIDKIIAKINAYGLGYKVEQYKQLNSSSMLNTVEISQIFGKQQLIELSKLFNMNEEAIKDEIAQKLMLLIK